MAELKPFDKFMDYTFNRKLAPKAVEYSQADLDAIEDIVSRM